MEVEQEDNVPLVRGPGGLRRGVRDVCRLWREVATMSWDDFDPAAVLVAVVVVAAVVAEAWLIAGALQPVLRPDQPEVELEGNVTTWTTWHRGGGVWAVHARLVNDTAEYVLELDLESQDAAEELGVECLGRWCRFTVAGRELVGYDVQGGIPGVGQ